MSSELERRLEGLLAEAPEPDPGAGEEALHRALRALHPAASAHRGLRTAVLVFASAAVLLAIAAGSLAAAGALHVSFGQKAKHRPLTTTELVRPKGANGIAAIVDGRLSVAIKGGFRLQGLTASAAALSPHALYVAAGIGQSLVAMAPDGRKAWSHPAGGEVVAIAWAPDGLRIAYVVRHGHRFALRAIYGNGTHDALIDRSVRPVRPSWQADNLAFAYVGGGGHAVVYDLGHQRHDVVKTAAPVTRLAFAPVGKALVVATPGSALVDGKTVASGEVEAIGWLHDRAAVALESGVTAPLVRTFARNGRPSEAFRVPGRVVALTGGLVVTRTSDRILAGWRDKSVNTVLGVKSTTPVADLAIG
jgi:hypothetical protein